MPLVRAAVPADIPELLRLRTLLFAGLEGDWGPPVTADGWRDSFAAALAEWLGEPTTRTLVIDGADGLAACGIGVIDRRLPNPFSANGLTGYVFGIVTDPAHRRRGHARAITAGLLDWFGDHGVGRVNLQASPEGEALYRDLGFADPPNPMLSLRR